MAASQRGLLGVLRSGRAQPAPQPVTCAKRIDRLTLWFPMFGTCLVAPQKNQLLFLVALWATEVLDLFGTSWCSFIFPCFRAVNLFGAFGRQGCPAQDVGGHRAVGVRRRVQATSNALDTSPGKQGC